MSSGFVASAAAGLRRAPQCGGAVPDGQESGRIGCVGVGGRGDPAAPGGGVVRGDDRGLAASAFGPAFVAVDHPGQGAHVAPFRRVRGWVAVAVAGRAAGRLGGSGGLGALDDPGLSGVGGVVLGLFVRSALRLGRGVHGEGRGGPLPDLPRVEHRRSCRRVGGPTRAAPADPRRAAEAVRRGRRRGGGDGPLEAQGMVGGV